MKYRVCKTWPDGLKVGTILQFNEYWQYEYIQDKKIWLTAIEVESNPEYFVPYLFTTEDGIDIYYGDKYWLKRTDDTLVECDHTWDFCYTEGGIIKGQLTFSTREAAQKFIDSQRKPIWKTEDGKDVFENDNVKWVCFNKFEEEWYYLYDLKLCSGNVTCVKDAPEIYRVFKNEYKMNAWIDEQNKPKYEVGEWLYFDNSDFHGIFRYKSCNECDTFASDESYWFPKRDMAHYRIDICYTTGSFGKDWNIAKATTSQIQDILSKVAIHKGFKGGVKYKNACDYKHEVVCPSSDFVYSTSSSHSGIFAKSNRFEGQGWIYCNSKWATIVETVPEYVEYIGGIGWGNTYIKVGQVFSTDLI